MGNGKSKSYKRDKQKSQAIDIDSTGSAQSRDGDTLFDINGSGKQIYHFCLALRKAEATNDRKDVLFAIYKHYIANVPAESSRSADELLDPKEFFIQMAISLGMRAYSSIFSNHLQHSDLHNIIVELWSDKGPVGWDWSSVIATDGPEIVARVVHAIYGNLSYDPELFGEELSSLVKKEFPDSSGSTKIKLDSNLSYVMTKSYKLTGREIYMALFESVSDRNAFNLEKFYDLLEERNMDYLSGSGSRITSTCSTPLSGNSPIR